MESERIMELAGKVASRYKRRVWWADHEELKQEASLAMCQALRTFDPERGIEAGAYLWRAGVLAARRSLLKSSAPVSAHHRLEVLEGLFREEVDPLMPTDHESPEELVGRAHLARSVRRRVEYLLGEEGRDFAIGVLGGTFTPQDVYEEHALEPGAVYRAIRTTRTVLQGDPALYRMWKGDDE